MKSNRTFGREGFVCAVLAAAALVACGGDSDEKIEESARGYVAAKDYNAATIQLKTLLQRNPNSANGRFLLGKTLLETGDPTAALVELQKAQELSVPDEQVLPEMARAMILLGQQIKVISQYAQTTLRDPAAQADLATSVAVAYALQNEPAKSLQHSQRALQSQPMYAPAVILQARLKVAENDLPGALLLLDEVLARNATDEKAGILKGDLLWRGKRDEAGALAAYNKVLEGTPNAVAAHVALIGIHSGAGRTTEARAQFDKLKKSAPNHPETLFIDAQFALQDGKPAVAREIAERMLKAMPENPRVLLLAAAAEYRLRSYVQAEGLLGRVLKVAPGHLPARHLLAQTYLRTGQANKALEALGSLIDSPKADGGSLALAGEAYMQIGDTKRADQAFQRAGKAAPDDTRVRTAVALAQFARGDTGAAVSALESIAAEDKGPRADFALVSARMQAGDTGGALKAVDAIAKKMPDKPLPDLLRGRVLLAKKDAAGAKAAFNAALAKDPKYFPAVSALAGLELVANNKDGARKRLEEFIQLDPSNAQARMALAELAARTGSTAADVAKILSDAVKSNPTQAGPRLALIEHMARMGDSQAALVAAQDGAAALPSSLPLLAALGRAQLGAGDHQQAISTYSRLISAQPKEPEYHMRLADAYMVAKDVTSARTEVRKVLELDPDSVPAKRAMAGISIQQGKVDEARTIARELQKSKPKDPSGFVLEGDIERQQKNLAGAVQAYRGAFGLSRTTDMLIRLHQTHLAAGQRPEADRLAAEWQKEHPKDFAFRYYLGDLSMARGDFPAAEGHYRAVLEAQPRNALALNNVAWLLAKQGKPGSVKMAESANEILPGRPQLMDTLATALAAEGDVKRALDTQRAAVSLDRKDPNLKLNLARLYLKAGDKSPARAELDELAKLGPQFPAQAEVAELLKLAR